MTAIKYTALIRTNNSMPLVAEVVAALRAQTYPPDLILSVDSSSSQEQRLLLNGVFDQIIEYPKDEGFNFSKAINIGVAACNTEYVLIVSSHILMEDPEAIARGISYFSNEGDNFLGCCYYPTAIPEHTWEVRRVDKKNVSHSLGLSNSCALLKVKKIIERPFREEVFSAEDQEWSVYFLKNFDASFYGITSYDVKYLNMHMNNLKTINEIISMAYFTHRYLLGPKYIIPRLLRAILALIRNRPERAMLHWTIAKELFIANFKKPIRKSSYY